LIKGVGNLKVDTIDGDDEEEDSNENEEEEVIGIE